MKIAVVFPGYGSQFVGMAKDLYDEHRLVQEYFEEASSCLNDNFVKLCFASSEAELASIGNAYVSLFLVSCAIFDLIQKETGCKPEVMAGCNQGEYAALFAAGGISFPDGLYLLKKYASFYEELLDTIDVRMIIVKGLEQDTVEDMCMRATQGDESAHVAVYYTDKEQVVSGHLGAITRIREFVSESGGVIGEAGVGVGLHSPLMDPVYTSFKPYMEKVDCKDLQVPMLSELLKNEQMGCQEVKESISNHINSTVRWTSVVDRLAECDTIIEIGPGTTLSDMLRERYPDKEILTVQNSKDLGELQKRYPRANRGENG